MTMDPLVLRAQQGDRAALEQLLAQVAPSVQRFGLRMCRDPHDADDALQDTLLTIATRLPEFKGRSSFTSWVFTLVRTACSRRRRGLKNQPPVADEQGLERVEESPGPEEAVSDAQLADALTRAMGTLPDDYREVLLLRDMEGLTAAEAADALAISVDALKSRLHRARAALREVLRPLLEPKDTVAGPGCPDVASWWSRRLEDEIRHEDCAEMEKHVEGCPSCGAACEALRRALGACRRAGDGPVDPKLQARIRAAVRAMEAGTPG